MVPPPVGNKYDCLLATDLFRNDGIFQTYYCLGVIEFDIVGVNRGSISVSFIIDDEINPLEDMRRSWDRMYPNKQNRIDVECVTDAKSSCYLCFIVRYKVCVCPYGSVKKKI